jgi:hypothetical protein
MEKNITIGKGTFVSITNCPPLPPFLSFCLANFLPLYLFHHQQVQSGNGHDEPSPQPLLGA